MTNTAQKYAAMTAARKEIIAKYNNAIIGHVVSVLKNELETLILNNSDNLTITFDQYRISGIIDQIGTGDLVSFLADIKEEIINNADEKNSEAKLDLINSYIQNLHDSDVAFDEGFSSHYVSQYPLIESDKIKNLEAVKSALKNDGFTLTSITAYKFKVTF